MKLINKIVLSTSFLLVTQNGFAQSFVNLNFESANVSGYSPGFVPASAAFPNWAAYYGSSSNPTNLNTSVVYYNGTSLGGALVILVDSNAPSGGAPLPLQGYYSALLEGSSPASSTTASIAQTGTIPVAAHSINFWGSLAANQQGQSLQLTFNGISLPYVVIGSGAGYQVYGADISSYAGQTGQFLFTAPVQSTALLDNIQFSSQSVPEPHSLTLCLGALSIAFSCFRKQKR